MSYTPSFYYPSTMYGTGGPYNPQAFGYGGMGMPAQAVGQQSMSQGTGSQGIIWVDGEVGAKAYQMPAGTTGPIALWDTNDQIIYLKSMNQMGMPNPLQKIRYHMEEQPQQMLPAGQGQSGNSGTNDQSDYFATKDDVSAMRNEIQALREMLQKQTQSGNQNGNQIGQNNSGNRGGNR